MRSMVINMEEAKLQTLVQIKAFLDGTSEIVFRVPKVERNQFIGRVLKRFGYAPHGRVDKGVLLRYIERMTGLSRQQVTAIGTAVPHGWEAIECSPARPSRVLTVVSMSRIQAVLRACSMSSFGLHTQCRQVISMPFEQVTGGFSGQQGRIAVGYFTQIDK